MVQILSSPDDSRRKSKGDVLRLQHEKRHDSAVKIQHAFRAYIHNRKLQKLQGQLRGLNFMDVVNLARMSQRNAVADAAALGEVFRVDGTWRHNQGKANRRGEGGGAGWMGLD
jgi:hypothetical protein